jgi:hypothetical protein
MKRNRRRPGSMIALLVLAIVLLGIDAAWAQTATPSEPTATKRVSATEVLATGAAAVGTFFYAPFKALAICPGMALASGASVALIHDNRLTAEYLLRVGCTGTYVITPEMVRGQQQFRGSGER